MFAFVFVMFVCRIGEDVEAESGFNAFRNAVYYLDDNKISRSVQLSVIHGSTAHKEKLMKRFNVDKD